MCVQALPKTGSTGMKNGCFFLAFPVHFAINAEPPKHPPPPTLSTLLSSSACLPFHMLQRLKCIFNVWLHIVRPFCFFLITFLTRTGTFLGERSILMMEPSSNTGGAQAGILSLKMGVFIRKCFIWLVKCQRLRWCCLFNGHLEQLLK